MMQYMKSQMPSVGTGKHAHYVYTVGVFAAVFVVADLLFSFFSQLSSAQQQSTTLVVALSASAFFAGSVNARRKSTNSGNAKKVPARKPIQTHEGEHAARQAGSQPAKTYAKQVAKKPVQVEREAGQPAPVAPPEVEREAGQPAPVPQKIELVAEAKEFKPCGPPPGLAPPEVEREAGQRAQPAEPQPEAPQKPLKAPRYASRRSEGQQPVPAEGDEATSTPLGAAEQEEAEQTYEAWRRGAQRIYAAGRGVAQARREGVEPSASTYSALMLSCVRSNDKEMSLKLFDQILNKYLNCDYEMTVGIPTDTRTRFFSFVAGQLDDDRLRKDGLLILVAIRDHGIQPPHVLQDRLVCAWGSKPPVQVLNYFKQMREDGFTLSSSACRCMLEDMISSSGEGGTTSAVSGGWPVCGNHDSGEQKMASPVDAAISQSDPACDAEETPAATTTERTPLRREASTFVPNLWEGLWQKRVATPMPGSWAPYPLGQYDEFSHVAMQQTGHQCNDYTTLILRNLPCPFLREDLIKAMDAKGFAGLYNFVYMPIDFKTKMGLGYAFVNLVTVEEVPRFMLAFGGFREWPRPSAKVCAVDLSKTQGLDANVARYRNSPVMSDEVPERFRPVLFAGTQRVPFPEPTKELPKVLPKSSTECY